MVVGRQCRWDGRQGRVGGVGRRRAGRGTGRGRVGGPGGRVGRRRAGRGDRAGGSGDRAGGTAAVGAPPGRDPARRGSGGSGRRPGRAPIRIPLLRRAPKAPRHVLGASGVPAVLSRPASRARTRPCLAATDSTAAKPGPKRALFGRLRSTPRARRHHHREAGTLSSPGGGHPASGHHQKPTATGANAGAGARWPAPAAPHPRPHAAPAERARNRPRLSATNASGGEAWTQTRPIRPVALHTSRPPPSSPPSRDTFRPRRRPPRRRPPPGADSHLAPTPAPADAGRETWRCCVRPRDRHAAGVTK